MADSAAELVRRAKAEAEEHHLDVICIAVGFDEETRFVFTSDRDPVAHLEQCIVEGGEPIGLLGCRQPAAGEHKLSFHARPFAEHADEDWVPEYLRQLGEMLEQKFLRLEGITAGNPKS